MEEPKYRGFSKDTGEWHYGFGWHLDGLTQEYKKNKGLKDHAILWTASTALPVELSSVGVYIGIKNEKGEELFEGDIVEAWSQGVKGRFAIKYRLGHSPGFILYPAWQNGEFWKIAGRQKEKNGEFYDDLTIIGNTFETPELMNK